MSKTRMQCHYEVLEVDRDADDDTIKKSYRKLALKWHPDKNLSKEDEAKQKFQLIQSAYEVLQDPQERAWYDKHRDQILRGNKSDYEDDSLDVFPYFTSSCYKGFGDDDEGFYAVYRNIFEKIATEDIEELETTDEFEAVPSFGNSSSSFDDVVLFYAHWESYSTKKSYFWLFTHDISDIRDRRILKLVDKEHKKIQQKARKERNEEVRSLVLFVKKRDRRMAEYRKMLEEKAQQNRLKSEQNRLDQFRKRNEEIKQQQKNSRVTVEHEEQLRQLEESYLNQYTDSEEDDDGTEEIEENLNSCSLVIDEAIDDELYCVACNKFFNSVSSKSNHEASKKHKQNMEALKKEMKDEEENFQNSSKTQEDEELLDEIEESEIKNNKKSKTKNKKGKKISLHKSSESEYEEFPQTPEKPAGLLDIDEDDWSNEKKTKKSKSKPKGKSEKAVEKNTSSKPEPETVVEKSVQQDEDGASAVEHRCATCSQVFPSKNKLFAHLKKTNHSIYLPKTVEKTSAKKKK